MIVSAKPIRTTPRWLQALLLLCAAVVLPLGVAHAQEPDYEAVAKRLEEAVRAGELSVEQAAAMMGELARAGFVERMEAAKRKRGPTRAEMAAVREKLGAAVKAGEISEEDARARWEAWMKGPHGARHITREDYARAEAELRKMVEDGKISEEDAKKRLGGLRRMLAGEGKRTGDAGEDERTRDSGEGEEKRR